MRDLSLVATVGKVIIDSLADIYEMEPFSGSISCHGLRYLRTVAIVELNMPVVDV